MMINRKCFHLHRMYVLFDLNVQRLGKEENHHHQDDDQPEVQAQTLFVRIISSKAPL